MWTRNRKYYEAGLPEETPGAPAATADVGGEPPLEENSELFADLAIHDEFVEPTVEPTVPTTEGAPSTPTDASAQSAGPASGTGPTTPPVAVAAPAQPQTPPVQAVGAPSSEPAAASPPATEQQPATGTPEPVDFEKHRAAVLPKLEELYKLTDSDAEELRTSPETVLPRIAARLHFEATSAAFNSVLGVLPGLVEQVIETQRKVRENEDHFYTRWPDLRKPEYEAAVLNSVRAYKSANPRATREELTERAGLMAMLSLGLNPQAAAAASQPTPPTPPAKPPTPAGAGFSAAPFTPTRTQEPQDDIAALVAAELAGHI